MGQATRKAKAVTEATAVYVALELSARVWKLGLTDGTRPPKTTSVQAGDFAELEAKVEAFRKRVRLEKTTPVVSCYEAGRDGFCVHRVLEKSGWNNRVVDSASIEVNRRMRRAKTDRLDATKLVRLLVRAHRGEVGVWKEVEVPSPAVEDARRPHRELQRLRGEATGHINRVRALMQLHGLWAKTFTGVRQLLVTAELPPHAADEVNRELRRHDMVQAQINEIKKQSKGEFERAGGPIKEKIGQLMALTGIGIEGASVLVLEFFGWRKFSNGKQVGSLAGLVPVHYASGDFNHDQGISKAGNKRVRRLMAQLTMCWLRLQPDSALSGWYQRRFGGKGKRLARIGKVALSRKLLVSLWRYVEAGVIPEGARLKNEVTA